MQRANEDIRVAIAKAGLKQWRVADRVGYSDCHFSVLLRKPLPAVLRESVLIAVRELASEEGQEAVAQ